MPVTGEQADVLRLLAANRSRNAYLGGGLISARSSLRISRDIDYFHDTADLALKTFDMDRNLLEKAGYTVEAPDPKPGFIRAVVSRGTCKLKIDWAHEAAWHFFQPLQNDDVGYELHWVDAATNKILAMASRREIRDGFDALFWHRNPLSLGALIWAASGKDRGLSPGLILEEIRRNARISPGDLAQLQLSGPVDLQAFGKDFRQAAREAEELLTRLPPDTAGNLFLDADGSLVEPDPADESTLANPLPPRLGGLVPSVEDSPVEP